MKIHLALSILGLVTVAVICKPTRRTEDLSQVYESDKIYEYKYDAQILNNVRGQGEEVNGFRLKSVVNIRRESGDIFTVWLREVKLRRMNDKIAPMQRMMLHSEKFQALENKEVEKNMSTTLRIPLKFQLRNGRIEQLLTHPTDKDWSVNVKKAVVNMLQNTVMTARTGDAMNKNIFEVNEPTIAGECKTLYTVLSPTHREPLMRVIKTPNYKKCVDPQTKMHIKWWRSIPNMCQCANSPEMKTDMLKVEHVITQLIEPMANGFFVKNVTSEAVYFINALRHPMDKSMETVALQRLSFVRHRQHVQKKVKLDKELFEAEADTEMEEQLVTGHFIPRPELLRLLSVKEQVQRDVALYQVYKKEIVQILHKMMTMPRNEIKMIKFLNRNLHMLKYLNKQDLFDCVLLRKEFQVVNSPSLYNELKEEKKPVSRKYLMRHLMQYLPTIATPSSVKVSVRIVNKIIEGNTKEIPQELHNPNMLSAMFRTLATIDGVNEEMMKDFLELVTSPKFHNRFMRPGVEHVYETAWLTQGALVQNLVQRHMRAWTRKTVTLKTVHKQMEVYDRFYNEVLKLTHKEELYRLLGCKVVGNTALQRFIPHMRAIFYKEVDTEIRVECLRALRNIVPYTTPLFIEKYKDEQLRHQAISKRNELIEFLLTVMQTETEKMEIRTTAYKLLMELQPEKPLLRVMIESVLQQDSRQLIRFMTTHMQQIARTQHICRIRFAKLVREVLMMVPRFWLFHSSNLAPVLHFSTHMRRLNIGAVGDADLTYENDEADPMPRHAHARINAQFMGYIVPLMEINMRQENLFEKLRAVLADKLDKQNLRENLAIEELLDLVKKYKKTTTTAELKLHLSLHIFGSEVTFVRITERDLQQPESLLKKIVNLPSMMRLMITKTLRQEFPTSIGFMHYMKVHFLTHTVVKDIIRPNGNVLSTPRILSQTDVEAHFGVNAHHLRAMMKVEASVDVKTRQANIEPFIRDSKFFLRWNVPTEKHRLLTISGTPTSIVEERLFSRERGITRMRSTIICHHRLVTRPTKATHTFQLFSNQLGMKMQVNVKAWCRNKLPFCRACPTYGPVMINVDIVPKQSTPNTKWHMMVVELIPKRTNRDTPYHFAASLKIENSHKRELLNLRTSIKLRMNREEREPKIIRTELITKLTITNPMRSEHVMHITAKLPNLLIFPTEMLRRGENIEDKLYKLIDRRREIKVRMNVTRMDQARTPIVRLRFHLRPAPEVSNADLKKRVRLFMPELLRQCIYEASMTPQTIDTPYFTPSCLELHEKLNMWNDMRLRVNTMPTPVLKKYMRTLRIRVQSLLYPFLETSERVPEKKLPTDARKQPTTNFMQVRVFIDPKMPVYFHMEIQENRERCVFKRIPMLTRETINQYKPLMMRRIVKKNVLQSITSVCQKIDNHIKTFQQIIHSMPADKLINIAKKRCPILLTADCADRDLFSVSYYDTPKNQEKTVEIKLNGKRMMIKRNQHEVTRFTFEGKELKQMDNEVQLPEELIKKFLMKVIYYPTIDEYLIMIPMKGVLITCGQPDLRRVTIRRFGIVTPRLCGACIEKDTHHHARVEGLLLKANREEYDEEKEAQETIKYINEIHAEKLWRSNIDTRYAECEAEHRFYKVEDEQKEKSVCVLTDNTQTKVLKSLKGVVVMDAINSEVVKLIKHSACPLVLLRTKDNKYQILVNRHMDIIIKTQDNPENSIIIKKEKRQLSVVKKYSKELLSSNEEMDLEQLKVKIDHQRVKVVVELKKVGIKLIRTPEQIKVKVPKTQVPKVAGMCKSLKEKWIQRPEDFIRKFTTDSPVCLVVKVSLRTCVVRKNTVRPLVAHAKIIKETPFVKNSEIKKILAKSGCPLILAKFEENRCTVLSEKLAQRKTRITVKFPEESEKTIRLIQERSRVTLEQPSQPEIIYLRDGRTVKIQRRSYALAVTISDGIHIKIAQDKVEIFAPETMPTETIEGLCNLDLPLRYIKNPHSVLQWILKRQINELSEQLEEDEVVQCTELEHKLKPMLRKQKYQTEKYVNDDLEVLRPEEQQSCVLSQSRIDEQKFYLKSPTMQKKQVVLTPQAYTELKNCPVVLSVLSDGTRVEIIPNKHKQITLRLKKENNEVTIRKSLKDDILEMSENEEVVDFTNEGEKQLKNGKLQLFVERNEIQYTLRDGSIVFVKYYPQLIIDIQRDYRDESEKTLCFPKKFEKEQRQWIADSLSEASHNREECTRAILRSEEL